MATLTLFKPTPPVTPKKFKKMNRPTDYLSVAERVNGRAAMVGFTSALLDEVIPSVHSSTNTWVSRWPWRVSHSWELPRTPRMRGTSRVFSSPRRSW